MMFSYEPKKLYDSLKELTIIPEDRLSDAYAHHESAQVPFEEVLLERDLIKDEDLGKTIAGMLQIPYVKLASVATPQNLVMLLPEEYARRHRLFIFDDKEGELSIACSAPIDESIVRWIEQKTGGKLKFFYATPRDMEYGLTQHEKDLQKIFDELLKSNAALEELGEDDRSIIVLVDKFIEYAYKNRASDIHLEPEKDKSIIRLRIDGVLQEILNISLENHYQMISRIKYLAKLRTDEHLSAQDGKFQISLPEEELDIRVSIVPITHGEKCVMRLLALRYRQFGLTDLGFSSEDLKKVEKVFKKSFGMILATGPTGSGKSTTMYAILKILNTNEKNIATIEDPVEYDMEGVNQIQVNPQTNLTFAEGLRSILRQDPNIIYVGEIRDKETAEISINAALTGHLVLSTLHTNDAVTALPRLLDMDIEPFLVSSTINLVIAQRLIRKICESCRVSYMLNEEGMMEVFPIEIAKQFIVEKKEQRFYKGKGCKVCHNTGYRGRIGIFEVLEMSPAILEMVVKKIDVNSIKGQAIKEGMRTMVQDGIQKALQGLTTIEEVLFSSHN